MSFLQLCFNQSTQMLQTNIAALYIFAHILLLFLDQAKVWSLSPCILFLILSLSSSRRLHCRLTEEEISQSGYQRRKRKLGVLCWSEKSTAIRRLVAVEFSSNNHLLDMELTYSSQYFIDVIHSAGAFLTQFDSVSNDITIQKPTSKFIRKTSNGVHQHLWVTIKHILCSDPKHGEQGNKTKHALNYKQ